MIFELFFVASIFLLLLLMLLKLKRWIQSTVGLSSSEANAMMILLPSMFILIFSEPAYRWLKPLTPIDVRQQIILDSIVQEMRTQSDESIPPKISLFNFDPNVSSLEELKSLGISEGVSKRIIQFRSKGGEFRIKSDLAKIYGLDSAMFKSLAPYILLPEIKTKSTIAEEKLFVPKPDQKLIVQYDLNLTDTSSLKSVKGIGSVLSKRILKYRERLGGFISKDQLKEVYGLDSTIIQKLSPFFVLEDFQPNCININLATEKELSDHPYISNRDARAIVTYRLQHGQFQRLNDLLKIKSLKESDVAKFGHYLSFE